MSQLYVEICPLVSWVGKICLGIGTSENFTGWQKSDAKVPMYTVDYALKMDVACVYYFRT